MMGFHQPELAVSDVMESCEENRDDGIRLLELAVSPDTRESCEKNRNYGIPARIGSLI